MLKIAGHIILSLLLFMSTTGLAISKHYCGGELVSTSIFSEADSCCDSGDCCKNENQVYQLDEDFSISQVEIVPEMLQVDLLSFVWFLGNLEIDENSSVSEFNFSDTPPPPNIKTSLAIRQTYLL